MLLGSLLLVGGIVLVLWGAERFTDGALRTATRALPALPGIEPRSHVGL